MSRNPEKHYQVIIVGGGILGAGVFRDLSLHGMRCLLLGRGDFGAQTSGSSSKMLHGGIRYLENYDFSLVRESLQEKNLWQKITPHLTRSVPFVYPIYHFSKHSLSALSVGLKIYGMLSRPHWFKEDPEQKGQLPRTLSIPQALGKMPCLRTQELVGAGLYYDNLVDDTRLCLETILDGINSAKISGSSEALNYHEVTSVHKKGTTGQLIEVTSFDRLTHQEKKFSAENLVITTGPFTDNILDQWKSNLNLKKLAPFLIPSKGSHIWVKKECIPTQSSLVFNTSDGRVLFVMPFNEAHLIGTTEVLPRGDLFTQSPTQQEVHYLLQEISKILDIAPFKSSDILASYSGIRPLVALQSHFTNKAKDLANTHFTNPSNLSENPNDRQLGQVSRYHKILQLQQNIYSLIGGKLTNYRVCASDLASQILVRYEMTYNPNRSRAAFHYARPSPLLFTQSPKISSHVIEEILVHEKVRTLEDLVMRRLRIPSLEFWQYVYQAELGDFHAYFAPYISQLKGDSKHYPF